MLQMWSCKIFYTGLEEFVPGLKHTLYGNRWVESLDRFPKALLGTMFEECPAQLVQTLGTYPLSLLAAIRLDPAFVIYFQSVSFIPTCVLVVRYFRTFTAVFFSVGSKVVTNSIWGWTCLSYEKCAATPMQKVPGSGLKICCKSSCDTWSFRQ